MRTIIALGILALLALQNQDPLEGHTGIRNYYRLRHDIATAGQPTNEAFADVKKAGFEAVLNLRTAEEGSVEERQVVEAAGLEYYNIPIGSDGITKEQVELFSEILGDSDNRPILVHCASSNRVGAMWYIHQVLDNDVPETEALTEAKKAGLTSESLEKRAVDYVEKNRRN